MHDPESQHEWLAFDFGVTGICGSYHNDWPLDAPGPVEHALNYLGPQADHTSLVLLLEDLVRLDRSPLSNTELDVLWQAPGDPLGGSPTFGGGERAWLEQLLAAVTSLARARGVPDSTWAEPSLCMPGGTAPAAIAHQALTSEVLHLSTALEGARTERPGESVAASREAVEHCLAVVCPELAFRFLLHAFARFDCPLSAETYARLEQVSRAFGHGSHVVDAHRYLLG
ncbi:hypothetical protein ACFWNR_36745 [Streptomyces virginiae]|uniref:hypothetical protein n=1 Tax=Streptomyces virginiae TaxID=1961 RepID=UPI003647982B